MTVSPDLLYSEPRNIDSLDDCRFYHTMDIPGFGLVRGSWDLRAGMTEYLGDVDFRGKRVLEVGTANGSLCFEMERRGAQVVAYDLDDQSKGWDLVPFGGAPDPEVAADRSAGMRMINNGWWLAHKSYDSKAHVVYGSVYDLPTEIGEVDIALLGSVLLHLRDPFLALQRALALVSDTVIVTEPASRSARLFGRLPERARLRALRSTRLPASVGFLPDPFAGLPFESWWRLTPWAVARMIQVLGFDVIKLRYHTQIFDGQGWPMYTLVGKRRTGQDAPVSR